MLAPTEGRESESEYAIIQGGIEEIHEHKRTEGDEANDVRLAVRECGKHQGICRIYRI